MKTTIEMAREANVYCTTRQPTLDAMLERFAELVRADEREAWEHKYARLQSLMEIRETQPNKPCCLAEREACAKDCEGINSTEDYYGERPELFCAEVIRARGNT